jgi:hypothetical protein
LVTTAGTLKGSIKTDMFASVALKGLPEALYKFMVSVAFCPAVALDNETTVLGTERDVASRATFAKIKSEYPIWINFGNNVNSTRE